MIAHALVKVRGVQPLGGYRLRLLFSDGAVGDVDVEQFFRGPVFEPLRDHRLFKSVRADRARGTVVWSNGADLAPDMLREIAQLVAEPIAATG